MCEQAWQYARGDVSCPTTQCIKCPLRNDCSILENAPALIKEAREYVVSDEFEELAFELGLEYNREDYKNILGD